MVISRRNTSIPITSSRFHDGPKFVQVKLSHDPYAPPRDIVDISDCYFYHVMDLPGHGQVGSEWDLRGDEEDYLGGVSFKGKRVLELGTASGYLCHQMEKKGAEVIGFDLPSNGSWDLVPFAGLDLAAIRDGWRDHIERLKNGWWFTHRIWASRAKVVYGNIYAVPEEIGEVDIATFGQILLHLRDPFQALASALRLTRETVIVTEQHPDQSVVSVDNMAIDLEGASDMRRRLLIARSKIRPRSRLQSLLTKARLLPSVGQHSQAMIFLPSLDAIDASMGTWWCLTPDVVCQFLNVLGFGEQTVTEHFATIQQKKVRLYTVVGKRTRAL